MERRESNKSLVPGKYSIILKPVSGLPVIEVNYLLFAVVSLMYFSGHLYSYLLVVVSMLFHEFGHIAAALLMKGRIYAIRVLPVGFNAVIGEGDIGEKAGIVISLGGPLINVILFAACYGGLLDSVIKPVDRHLLAIINLYLFLFNILPLFPMDGGRVLSNILSGRLGLSLARRYVRRVSFIIIFIIICGGIVQIMYSRYNFSLLISGIYFFLLLKPGYPEASVMNIKHLLFRRSRLLKKGVYEGRSLVVIESALLSETLSRMDFDRFHFIYLLDEHLKIIKILSEQEILEYLLKYDSSLSYRKVMELESGENKTDQSPIT